MKEIDKENATQQEAMCTQYKNKNKVAIEFSRKQELEHSFSRTFVRLFVQNYKWIRRSRRRGAVRIQSALCEVACKENSCGLKISVASKTANRCMRRITNKCYCLQKSCKQRRIWNKQLQLQLLLCMLYKQETVAHKIVRTIKN